MKIGKTLSRNLTSYLLAVLYAFIAGGVFYIFRGYLDNKHDESLLFLPVVIACAVRLGFGPAVTASLLGVAIWDYFFIPPRFTMAIGRPGDGVDLAAFLVAAITTSQIAAQARRTAEQAELREREIATLYKIGQIVSSEIESDRILDTMAEQIAQTCQATQCVVFRIDQAAPELHLAASSSCGAAPLPADADQGDSAVPQAIHAFAESLALDARRSVGTVPHETARPLTADPLAFTEQSQTEPSAAVQRNDGDASGIYFPLHDGNAMVGVLFVGPRLDNRPRDSNDTKLVAALGNYAASVIARQAIADESRQRVQNAARFEERNRLAREIHDTLAQGLTGIVIQLQAAEGGTAADHWAAVTQAKRLAQDCLTEARRSVRALRPGALEGRDLPTALSEMLVQMTQAAQLAGSFHTIGTAFILPDEINAHLLRIAQEAVTNTIRHAGASQIRITLTYEAAQVQLQIIDDGCGFIQGAAGVLGFGLIGMRERALQLGAQLDVDSATDRGAAISVRLPVAGAMSAGIIPVA